MASIIPKDLGVLLGPANNPGCYHQKYDGTTDMSTVSVTLDLSLYVGYFQKITFLQFKKTLLGQRLCTKLEQSR